MISEVVNAIILTYFATEYKLVPQYNNNNNAQHQQQNKNVITNWFFGVENIITKPQNKLIIIIFIAINSFDYIIGLTSIFHVTFDGFLHIPKILFAAIIYIIAIYYDVKRYDNHNMNIRNKFLPLLGVATLRVLPLYPFLAVFISFIFLFVITIFENLGMPIEILNWPIYYGTLYGPFSYIYFQIKEQVLKEKNTLPTINSGGVLSSSNIKTTHRWNST